MEAIETDTNTPEQQALDFFTNMTIGYAPREGYMSQFHNLWLTASGAAKLASTAGWIAGQRSGELALSLYSNLSRLNGRGEMLEISRDRYGHTLSRPVEFPSQRVMLGDDGTLGGFSVCFCLFVSDEDVQEKAEALYKADESEHKELLPLYEARRELAVQDCLTTSRYRSDSLGCTEIEGHYRFWMSGGLLLHGYGEVFAVTLTPHTGWSVHT
jgi:hypothetical protein